MSSSIAVPTRDDEVRRICALKPKVTSGEVALFGADMAPIVRLLGQATSAIDDANQILRAYREESGRLAPDAVLELPFDIDVAKAACDITALRQACNDAHSSIARRAIEMEIGNRRAATPRASPAS